MRRTIMILAILAVALGTCRPLSTAAVTGLVYTANEAGKSISVIDVSTGGVTNVSLPIAPHNVQISHDGRLLLAVGMIPDTTRAAMQMADEGEMVKGKLLILDAASPMATNAADVELGHHPAHVILDPADKLAYVSNSEDNDVLVIDLAGKKVVGRIATGTFPHGMRMSPNGREIYVADVKDSSVSVIDVAQSKEVARIAVGKGPVQVAFTPDGKRVYVSLQDENKVAVVDTATRKKIADVRVGRNPIQVFTTPDGRHIYVANQGTPADPDSTVSVIATGKNSVIATIVTGKGAHGVVVSDDGSRAFIANLQDDTVSAIDTATEKVVGTFKVGRGPSGITFRPAVR